MAATKTPKIRILLIEDNRLLREGISAMLKKQADFRVSAAAGSGDATQAAEKFNPHVVLLDLGLTTQNSLDIAAKIKKTYPKAEIIVMDLLPAHTEIVEFVRVGISGFILKDATIDDFLHTIRSVAQGKKVLPPSLTGSLFSHIVESALQGGHSDYVLEAVKLTKREHEVVALITKGMSNKEIASDLNIALHTVKSHVHNTLEKLALHTRLELAMFARSGPSERDISGRSSRISD